MSLFEFPKYVDEFFSEIEFEIQRSKGKTNKELILKNYDNNDYFFPTNDSTITLRPCQVHFNNDNSSKYEYKDNWKEIETIKTLNVGIVNPNQATANELYQERFGLEGKASYAITGDNLNGKILFTELSF